MYLSIYLFHLFIYCFVSPFLWKILKGEGWSRLYGFINCLENLNANIRSFGASHNGAMGPLNEADQKLSFISEIFEYPRF